MEIRGCTKIIGGMEGVVRIKKSTSRGGSIKVEYMEPQGGLRKKDYQKIDSQ